MDLIIIIKEKSLSLFKLLKMKEELLRLIEEKSPGSKPLYLVIRGSHAYGTNIETFAFGTPKPLLILTLPTKTP